MIQYKYVKKLNGRKLSEADKHVFIMICFCLWTSRCQEAVNIHSGTRASRYLSMLICSMLSIGFGFTTAVAAAFRRRMHKPMLMVASLVLSYIPFPAICTRQFAFNWHWSILFLAKIIQVPINLFTICLYVHSIMFCEKFLDLYCGMSTIIPSDYLCA